MTQRSSLSALSNLPSVSISASCGGVTLTTSGPEAGAGSSLQIPIEFLPGIIVLLQGELNNINNGHYCLDSCEQDTQDVTAEVASHELMGSVESIDRVEPRQSARALVLNASK